MFQIHKTFLAIILISTGASFGSYLRFQLINQFSLRGIAKHWIILFINAFSCFGLGFITALEDTIKTYDAQNYLRLFFVIGFLASFSTFSSFLLEFFFTLKSKNWFESLLIFFTSLFGGLLFALAGYSLGNN